MQRILVERVAQALASGTPLSIRGSGSKLFYGRPEVGEPLDMSGYRGIVAYQPSELVITARAGTPLAEIESLLADNGQMLAFEPPHFGPAASLGGMVAAGLSGPRRPWAGAVRDAVLGVQLLNGRGEVLRLGGQVMKNVAGYDLSRLMVGALGTLGVLLEVSVRVLPRPIEERTVRFELDAATAAARQIEWGRRPWPISALVYGDGQLHVRLSGSSQGVEAAYQAMGGEVVAMQADDIWAGLREQTLPFFANPLPLWRISLPAAAPALNLPGQALVEWGGELRWQFSDLPARLIWQRAAPLGGHATLFRAGQGGDPVDQVFQPLPPALLALHQRLKQSLDPAGIFNPGRLFAEF